MHSPNLGYVLREVGIHGYLLELCRGPLRKLTRYRYLWLNLRLFLPVLRLLCRIHGLTRPIQIPVLDFYLCCHVHHALDCLLRVRFSCLQLL